MADEVLWLGFEDAQRYVAQVLMALGSPEEDASTCADVVVAADRRGFESHGIARFKSTYYDRIRHGVQSPITRFDIVKERASTAVVDGNNGMGQVISKKAMDLAIHKAGEYGMGMVAVRNSNHFGIAGYYASMAVDADMIGIVGTNARPSVAPTFGVEGMLGTNPLTFGMPTDEDFPFILDCATSISQRGKLELYDRANRPIPEGWVIGKDGRTRTDTSEILRDLQAGRDAALLPLGGIGEQGAGYKGYGYSTVVEILSAALQGGAYLRMLSGLADGKRVPVRLGHFFIAIDISAFTDPDEFRRMTGDILRALRASKKMPGEERIYTAGEKEHIYWLEHRYKGIPITPPVHRDLKAMGSELGLPDHMLPDILAEKQP